MRSRCGSRRAANSGRIRITRVISHNAVGTRIALDSNYPPVVVPGKRLSVLHRLQQLTEILKVALEDLCPCNQALGCLGN